MQTHATVLMIASVMCLIALAAPVGAQVLCPEGRTLAGTCVDPGLARAMRSGVIANSQPKFSYTAPARLPSEDRGYQVSPQLHEIYQLFTFPPIVRPVNNRP